MIAALQWFCTTNPPEGCLFGILAGTDNVNNDWVASYKKRLDIPSLFGRLFIVR